MGRTRLTWLLLALGCLVQCVRSDDPAATTTKPPTAAPSTATVTTTTPAPVPATTTASPPPAITERQTTRAPSTTAAPTAAPTTTTAAPAAPATTAPPPDPVTTAQATNPATNKPSTSSGGGGAVIITTVSKPDPGLTTSRPKSSSHSPLAPAAVTTPGPVSGPAFRSAFGPTPGPTSSQTRDVTTARPQVMTTVPHQPRDSGTTKVTNVPAPTTSIKGTTPSDATTKHVTKDAAGTPGNAVVTSKSVPSQTLGSIISMAPSTDPNIPKSTSKSPTAVTGGRPGPDLFPVGSTEPGVQTTAQQTTIPPTTTVTTTAPMPKVFSYYLNKGHQPEEKELVVLCQRLMASLEDGNCTIAYRHHNDKTLFDSVEITGKVKTTIVTQLYDDATKKPTDNRTLITILASCGALLIMIIILAVCASHHRKPYNENQLHLTEELQTVENGYHDNPTLEVMEVGADMQEKKPPLSLNNGGEFNDSWIVPIDNLLKEEGPDEEDTHL